MNARQYAANTVAQLAVVLVSAGCGAIGTYVLTRALDGPIFSLWTLVMSLAGYAGACAVGVPSLVAKFVAAATAGGDPLLVRRSLSTGLYVLSWAALAAATVSTILAAGFPLWFPQVPAELVGPARLTLLLLCASAITSFLAAGVHSYWMGLRQAAQMGRAQISYRVVSLAALLLAATLSAHVVYMALALLAAQFIVLWRQTHEVRIHANMASILEYASTAHARDYRRSVRPLVVWNIALLVINGMDITIVAQLDFAHVGPYGIALTLSSMYSAVLAALAATLLPATAALPATSRSEETTNMLISATKWHVFVSLIFGAALVVVARPLLELWVGPAYMERAFPLALVLIIAQAIRMSTICYANMLIATGAHEKVILSPILEAVANLIASIFLGIALGPIGVAFGTVVGGVVAVVANVVHNMPRHPEFPVQPRRYLIQGLMMPLLYAMPVLMLAYVTERWLSAVMLRYS